MDFTELKNTVITTVTAVGIQVIGAILIWVVGRMLIGFVINLIGRSLEKQKVDTTINGYAKSTLEVLLNIILVISILGYFGIQTTSFAGLIAAAAFAIGVAWGGLLANFAAGVFLVMLRPFKDGDFVNAGGVTGTVVEVGLFCTTINTPDNIRSFVGNNKIFSDTIQNFTANPHRRVDLTAQLAFETDPLKAFEVLQAGLKNIANVLPSPAPEVTILAINDRGPQLAVRPYCHNNNYWQVYFDTNLMIRQEFEKAGFPPPEGMLFPGR